MSQLLEKLIVQAKVEAREGLRKSILSLNGLAGLYILKFEVHLYMCVHKCTYLLFCSVVMPAELPGSLLSRKSALPCSRVVCCSYSLREFSPVCLLYVLQPLSVHIYVDHVYMRT